MLLTEIKTAAPLSPLFLSPKRVGAHREEDRVVTCFSVPKPWPMGFECSVTLLRDLTYCKEDILPCLPFFETVIGPLEGIKETSVFKCLCSSD